MRLSVLFLFTLALLPCDAFGFDNQRPGFTLGVYPGIGWPSSSDYWAGIREGEVAVAPALSLGVGLTATTALSIKVSPVFYSSSRDNSVIYLTSALGVQRYFGRSPRAFHVGAAAGIYLDGSRGYDGSPPAPGFLGQVAAGYLFGHIDCQASFLAGRRFVDSGSLSLVTLSLGYLFY